MIKLLRTIRSSEKVARVAFSRKGDLIAAAGAKGSNIWVTSTGNLSRSLPLSAQRTGFFSRAETRAFSISFSPDGSKLATGNYDHSVAVWDLRQEVAPIILKGHKDCVTDVQFVDPVALISYGNRDKCVRVWDTSTGTSRKVFQVTGFGAGMAVSHDGKSFAVGDCIENTYTLYDSYDGRLLRTLSKPHRIGGFLKGSSGVVFSPDGGTVLTGMWDGTAVLWDVYSGVRLKTFSGHKPGLGLILAFSPDGKHILTGGITGDGTVRLWDCGSTSQIHCFEGQNYASSVGFSPDGKLAMINDIRGSIQLWDLGIVENLMAETTVGKVERRTKLDEVRTKKLPCGMCGKHDDTLDVCDHCLGVYCRTCHSTSPTRMRWSTKSQSQIICCPLCGEFLL